MAQSSYGRMESRYDLQQLGGSGDLGFDSGGGKEQIDDHAPLSFARGVETNGGQAPRGFLFENGENRVAESLQTKNDRLRLTITGNGDSEIDVPAGARLCPRRNGQVADESPRPPQF